MAPVHVAWPPIGEFWDNEDVRFLTDRRRNPHILNAWGFTIYRAVFTPGSDERFVEGLRRLEAFVRFNTRMSRFEGCGGYDDDYLPPPGQRHATDLLAERLRNEVVEDYPGRGDNACSGGDVEREGTENFSPVGRAFDEWVDDLDVSHKTSNARYDQCLVVDELALRSLEKLPAEAPEVRYQGGDREAEEEERSLRAMQRESWVWILDRAAMVRLEEGKATRFPPWVRVHVTSLDRLWFMRFRRCNPDKDWTSGIEEDRYKGRMGVYWWNEIGTTLNRFWRVERGLPEL